MFSLNALQIKQVKHQLSNPQTGSLLTDISHHVSLLYILKLPSAFCTAELLIHMATCK